MSTPYATLANLNAQFGEREVIALTDRDLDGLPDQAVVDAALGIASDEIDAYLVSRYALPLASVPRLLSTLCCDIARYRLTGAEAQETDPSRNRYRDAIKMLEKIKSATRNGHAQHGADTQRQTHV
jgi:phage gp36-like protein